MFVVGGSDCRIRLARLEATVMVVKPLDHLWFGWWWGEFVELWGLESEGEIWETEVLILLLTGSPTPSSRYYWYNYSVYETVWVSLYLCAEYETSHLTRHLSYKLFRETVRPIAKQPCKGAPRLDTTDIHISIKAQINSTFHNQNQQCLATSKSSGSATSILVKFGKSHRSSNSFTITLPTGHPRPRFGKLRSSWWIRSSSADSFKCWMASK